MNTFTKEQLIARANHLLCVGKAFLAEHPEYDGMAKDVELFGIALASLEAEPVITVGDGGDALAYRRLIQQFAPGTKLYTAPQVPGELLSAMEEVLRISDRDHEAWHQARAGIVACRAAMQGKAESQNVRPVMFIDGDISPADAEKLAVAIREFNSEPGEPSQMIAEPVSNCEELPSREHFISLCNQFWNWQEADEINAGDEEPRLEWNGSAFTHRVTQALWRMYQASPGNSPVIPDGWVMVPVEPTAEMYDAGDRQLATKQVWDAMIAAAPQQEAG